MKFVDRWSYKINTYPKSTCVHRVGKLNGGLKGMYGRNICNLCFYFSTKMLRLNAPFFSTKIPVFSPKKSIKCSYIGVCRCSYILGLNTINSSECLLHAPFNHMWTLKFKAQLTNAFLATVNQMFGGSFRLSTTAEHCFVDRTVLNDSHEYGPLGSIRKLGGAAEHLIDGSENAFVG